MVKPAERAAEKLFSALKTAQDALNDLHPVTHETERQILQQTIIRMRGVYARLMKSVKTT